MCDLKRSREKAEMTFIWKDLEKFDGESGIYTGFQGRNRMCLGRIQNPIQTYSHA